LFESNKRMSVQISSKMFFLILFVKVKDKYVKKEAMEVVNPRPLAYFGTPYPMQEPEFN